MGDESDAGRGHSPSFPAGVMPCMWSQKLVGRRRAHTHSSSSNNHQRHSPYYCHHFACIYRCELLKSRHHLTASDLCRWTHRPPTHAPSSCRAHTHLASTAHTEPEEHSILQCLFKLTLSFSYCRLGQKMDSVYCCSTPELTQIHCWMQKVYTLMQRNGMCWCVFIRRRLELQHSGLNQNWHLCFSQFF